MDTDIINDVNLQSHILQLSDSKSEVNDGDEIVDQTITKSTLPKPILKIRVPIKQNMTIKQIIETNCPTSWEQTFENAKNELNDVNDILIKEEGTYGPYFPLKKDLFRAFWLTRLDQVKVVLVGQDPYHDIAGDKPRAVGLSFSVSKEASIPSSLRNMYTELTRTGFTSASHGDLSSWAHQGVLLLNSCLTVRPRTPGSHGQIWLGFIQKVIDSVCERNMNCIFILLGKNAQRLQKMLGNNVKTICAGHPSGLNRFDPFVGSDTFLKVNEMLVKTKQTPINWNLS